MISVGIDVSKEKSTVCIVKPCAEILVRPFEVMNTEEALKNLSTLISKFDDEIRIVMEVTGVYHLPILSYLKEKNIFVSIVNPLEIKIYRCKGLRNAKTDKIDSIIIANYGIDFWHHLKNYDQSSETY